MILYFILQEIAGITMLSVPIIVLYNIIPKRFFRFPVIISCSLSMGLFFAFSNYLITHKMISNLKFIPSGLCMKSFEDEVTKCRLKSKDVNLYYRHNGVSLAFSVFNSVMIDPMVWKNIEDDPQIPEIKKYLNKVLPDTTLSMLHKINDIYPVNAQNFFLRHELGHIYHNYSNKYLVTVWAIGLIGTVAALTVAGLVLPALGGIGALTLGLLTASIFHLSLTYLNNVFFKAREELKADAFAAKFSSKEEIEEAANFFEKYDELFANDYNEIMGLFAHLPKIIFTGYPSGKNRAQYLRNRINSQG